MDVQQAYSFCDCVELLTDKIKDLGSETKYIYLGSYFCEKYFCNISDFSWKKYFDELNKNGITAVLVIPTPSQQGLVATKQRVDSIVDKFGDSIGEIVINDVAMLEWITEKHPDFPVWIGRNMDKEIRDPRFEKNFFHKKLLEKVEENKFGKENIIGAEIDLIGSEKIDPVGNKKMLSIHRTFTYISAGRICEFASVDLPTDKKFQIFRSCKCQCVNNWIKFEKNNVIYLKHGKAVYAYCTDEPFFQEGNNIRFIKNAIEFKMNKV